MTSFHYQSQRRQMSDGAFEPEKYKDDYRLRVLAMIDAKLKGREITTAPQPAHKAGPVIDLMEALKQSIRKAPERKVAGTRKSEWQSGKIL